MNKIITMAVCAAGAALLAGCASTHARETQLDMKTRTAALEPQDVRGVVEKMVDSMIEDDEIAKAFGGTRPVLDIDTFKNSTTMHLNMKSITDSIRTKLIRSRKFRFMDSSTSGTDLKRMNEQALNGLTDPSQAIAAGQQTAAQLYLYGDLSEMYSQTDDVTDRYYKFTLNLKDLRTGELLWSDEKEIRKQQTRGVIGF